MENKKQSHIEAEAYTNISKERLIYIAGYTSCIKNLRQWLQDNQDEHISAIYNFIESEE